MANGPTRRAQLHVESLEDRRLLAASVTLTDGVLQIQGTDSDDAVRVFRTRQEVIVVASTPGETPVRQTFARADVTGIEFHGGLGNDQFVNLTPISATVFGDDGDDFLLSGRGKDVVHGGAGNDVVIGGRGADQLFGDEGADVVVSNRKDVAVDDDTTEDVALGTGTATGAEDQGGGRLLGGRGHHHHRPGDDAGAASLSAVPAATDSTQTGTAAEQPGRCHEES